MPVGIVVAVLIAVIVFAVYKRQMVIKMFSINVASMADEFRMQMQDTADTAVGKLEQQMTQLEYLLEEADAKIRILEDLLQQAEHRPPVSIPEASIPGNDNVKRIQPLEPYGSSEKLQMVSTVIANPVSVPNNLRENVQDKRQQVVAMHRQGYHVVEIAKAVSIGKGEVMLILELNKNS